MTPTGRLVAVPDGVDLLLSRTFRAPIDDVWASVTEPERTARWFGPWRGEAGVGRTIEVRLEFEDTAPWCPMRIEACEPPTRLAVHQLDEHGAWFLELTLTESGGTTELTLTHHLTSADGVEEIGPGWEYYLDLLVASRSGAALPSFDDYFPSMKGHYADAAAGFRAAGNVGGHP